MSNKLKPCVLLPGWVVSVPTVGVLGDRDVDVIDCGVVWLQRSTREKRYAMVTKKTSQMTGLRLGERRMGEIACMVVVVVVVVERDRERSAYIYETTCTKRADLSQQR